MLAPKCKLILARTLSCILLMCWLVGFRQFLLVQLPVVILATSAGAWLFYMHHNFEGTYWQRHDQWDYVAARMKGSSFIHLPKVLQWFSANIGPHHIHHLDSRIPHYRLQECFDKNPEFQCAKRLTLWDSLPCVSLKLWDENQGMMVSFRRMKGCTVSRHESSLCF